MYMDAQTCSHMHAHVHAYTDMSTCKHMHAYPRTHAHRTPHSPAQPRTHTHQGRPGLPDTEGLGGEQAAFSPSWPMALPMETTWGGAGERHRHTQTRISCWALSHVRAHPVSVSGSSPQTRTATATMRAALRNHPTGALASPVFLEAGGTGRDAWATGGEVSASGAAASQFTQCPKNPEGTGLEKKGGIMGIAEDPQDLSPQAWPGAVQHQGNSWNVTCGQWGQP